MKRIISLLITFVMMLSCFSLQSYGTARTNRQYGDINNDNFVDIIDVTLVQRYLVSIITFDGVQKETADFDHDNVVSSIDVTLIQRFIAKISIPEHYGGEYEPMSFIRLLYADYESGKAMVGVPVTFTAQGGYPYYGFEADDIFNPNEYKFVVYSSVNPSEPIAVRDYTEDNTFSYVFERADCTYRINAYARNRYHFESELYYDNFRVVEPYEVNKPIISSIYTDKYGNKGINSQNSFFKTSCRWNDLYFSVIAEGGSGDYLYSFEYKTKEKTLVQEYSANNNYLIASEDFPGWDEYEEIKPYMSYLYRYDSNNVVPYELTVKVRDSNGNETTETVFVSAIDDFDAIG